MRNAGTFRSRPSKTPQDLSALDVNSNDLIGWRCHKHYSVAHHRRCFMTADNARRESPNGLQFVDILCCDLLERAVTPTIVCPAHHQPISILGLFKALGSKWLVVLENARHGCRWLLLLRLLWRGGCRRLLLRDHC